jgi:hypothetical protein
VQCVGVHYHVEEQYIFSLGILSFWRT